MLQTICNIDFGGDVSPILYSRVHSNFVASLHNVWPKIKTVFEPDHKNALSMAMSIWFRIVTFILDAIKAA